MQTMTEAEKEISVLLSHIRPLKIDLKYHREQVSQLEKQITEKEKKIVELMDSE